MAVIDLSDPSQPQLGGQLDFPSWNAISIDIDGSTAVVGGLSSYWCEVCAGLRVLDIWVPTAPVELAHVGTGGDSCRVPRITVPEHEVIPSHVDALSGGYVFMREGKGIHVLDVRDSLAPADAGYVETGATAEAIAGTQGMAVVALGDTGIKVVGPCLAVEPRRPEGRHF